jgi:DNA gyrase/topoisomerase IV subunit A
VKELQITEDQAEVILNLKVRQLSRLDNETIEGQRAEERKVLSDLKRKLKNPAAEVAVFLREHASKFKLVKNDWSTQWQL